MNVYTYVRIRDGRLTTPDEDYVLRIIMTMVMIMMMWSIVATQEK